MEAAHSLVNEILATCYKNGTLILLQCSILSQADRPFVAVMLVLDEKNEHYTVDTGMPEAKIDTIFGCFRLSVSLYGRLPKSFRPGHSAQGFSPRPMRSEISAWNAGGPKANHSSPIW